MTLEKILTPFVIFLVVLILYITIMLGYIEYNRPICLEKGYATIITTYDFGVYCVTGNEVVIPINEVR